MLYRTIVPALLALTVLATGCTPYAYQGRVAYDTRTVGAPHDGRVFRRVERDAQAYVQMLDRRLRLNPNQARRIEGLLADRAVALMNRARPGERQQLYPFPRRDADRADRRVRNWWRETDRRIEQHLNRRQVRDYRAMFRYDDRRDRYDDRGDWDGRDGRRGRRRGQ